MRMTAHELVADRGHDVAEIEQLRLLGHPRVEHDLEQQVAELAPELVERAALDRVRDLVRLLERVRRDRRERLLAVPRAAAVGTREASP